MGIGFLSPTHRIRGALPVATFQIDAFVAYTLSRMCTFVLGGCRVKHLKPVNLTKPCMKFRKCLVPEKRANPHLGEVEANLSVPFSWT